MRRGTSLTTTAASSLRASGTGERIRVGVIGNGGWGRDPGLGVAPDALRTQEGRLLREGGTFSSVGGVESGQGWRGDLLCEPGFGGGKVCPKVCPLPAWMACFEVQVSSNG